MSSDAKIRRRGDAAKDKSPRPRVPASPRPVTGCKPVIGLAGGIGAGKSTVAVAFARLGCAVIDSDRQSHEALAQPEVVERIRQWWGEGVFDEAGRPSRAKLAEIVFADPEQLARLNGLVHPVVHRMRQDRLAELAGDSNAVAVVLDSPLLFEAGVDGECDAVVFVDAPAELRMARLASARGWSADEVERRQRRQMDLEAKRAKCDYVIVNAGPESDLDSQAAAVLAEVLRKIELRN